MLSYFIQFQSITDTQGISKSLQFLRVWKSCNSINKFVLTMDKVAVSLLLTRADKNIQTAFCEKQI